MANVDHDEARKGRNDSDNALTADNGDVANAELIEQLFEKVESLEKFKTNVIHAQEKARLAGLSHVDRMREEAERVRDRLVDAADPSLVGLLSAQYIDATSRADRAEADEQAREADRLEYLAGLPEHARAREVLVEKFGDEGAGAIIDAITGVAAKDRAVERGRLLKKAAKVALVGASYASVIAILADAAKPKTVRGRLTRAAFAWLSR